MWKSRFFLGGESVCVLAVAVRAWVSPSPAVDEDVDGIFLYPSLAPLRWFGKRGEGHRGQKLGWFVRGGEREKCIQVGNSPTWTWKRPRKYGSSLETGEIYNWRVPKSPAEDKLSPSWAEEIQGFSASFRLQNPTFCYSIKLEKCRKEWNEEFPTRTKQTEYLLTMCFPFTGCCIATTISFIHQRLVVWLSFVLVEG